MHFPGPSAQIVGHTIDWGSDRPVLTSRTVDCLGVLVWQRRVRRRRWRKCLVERRSRGAVMALALLRPSRKNKKKR